MTRPNASALANASLYGSLAINAAVCAWDMAQGQYGFAALQSVVIVALAAWLAIAPKLHRRLDVHVDEAVNRCRLSALAVQEMEHHMRNGTVSINIAADRAERRH